MLDIILAGLLTAVLARPARRRLQRERYAYWMRAMKEFQAEITTLRDAFLSTATAAGNFSRSFMRLPPTPRSIVVIKWGDPQ